MNNYINIDKSDLDTPIYRIFKLEYFLELVDLQLNTFVSPFRYEDPMENVILRLFERDYRLENFDNPNFFDFQFRNSVYCQSWSLDEESDALWRIYSPNKTGIMIKSTIGAMYESLADRANLGNVTNTSCFAGKVLYKEKEEILKEYSKLKENYDLKTQMISPQTISETLFLKRHAFKHENEIRFVFYDVFGAPGSDKKNPTLQSFKCFPSEFVDEIILDPRMNYQMVNMISSFLSDRLHYDRVYQSNLYDSVID